MLTQAEQVKMQIAELANSLEQELPNIPTLLRDIHSKLKADDSTVTLLSEEEIATVVAGLKLHTNTNIDAPATAKKKKATLKNTSASDL